MRQGRLKVALILTDDERVRLESLAHRPLIGVPMWSWISRRRCTESQCSFRGRGPSADSYESARNVALAGCVWSGLAISINLAAVVFIEALKAESAGLAW